MTKQWYLYILKCSDSTLYTGITIDLEKRLAEHNGGCGAKYTRSRLPAKMVYFEKCQNRSEASKREIEVKAMPKSKKLSLINSLKEQSHAS